MKNFKLLLVLLPLAILIFSCSNNPAKLVSVNKATWNQMQSVSGTTGDKLNYSIEVENLELIAVKGTVTLKISYYDNSSSDENVDFSNIEGLSSKKIEDSINVNNKKVTNAEVKEINFIYR
jgi:PBP1b-binding outer membrane lipoprotein LpoB